MWRGWRSAWGRRLGVPARCGGAWCGPTRRTWFRQELFRAWPGAAAAGLCSAWARNSAGVVLESGHFGARVGSHRPRGSTPASMKLVRGALGQTDVVVDAASAADLLLQRGDCCALDGAAHQFSQLQEIIPPGINTTPRPEVGLAPCWAPDTNSDDFLVFCVRWIASRPPIAWWTARRTCPRICGTGYVNTRTRGSNGRVAGRVIDKECRPRVG
jgi:hypothetical protein